MLKKYNLLVAVLGIALTISISSCKKDRLPFTPDVLVPGPDVNFYALTNDNKILIGGSFTTFNSINQNRIIRLNSDGTKDSTFSIGTGFNSTVWDIDLQNEKIIAVGNFVSYNSTSSNKIVRLNSDGNLDTSFDIGNGFDNNCYTLNVLNDNKILIGGEFNNFNKRSDYLRLFLLSDNHLGTFSFCGVSPNSFSIKSGRLAFVNRCLIQSLFSRLYQKKNRF